MALNFLQIVREIDKNCKSNSVSYPLTDKVQDINLALSDAISLAIQTGGTWQFDDTNHTDYPIISTNLVSGQRDYTFTSDEQGNLILDIYKVMVKISSDGDFQEIYPVDQQSDSDMESFYSGQNVTGIPSRYDKTANGFFLDCIPSYNSTNGLKVFISREGSFFNTSDSTKKPGIDPRVHEYLALVPSYKYARTNSLSNVSRLEKDMMNMEKKIEAVYAQRERDTEAVLQSESFNKQNYI